MRGRRIYNDEDTILAMFIHHCWSNEVELLSRCIVQRVNDEHIREGVGPISLGTMHDEDHSNQIASCNDLHQCLRVFGLNFRRKPCITAHGHRTLSVDTHAADETMNLSSSHTDQGVDLHIITYQPGRRCAIHHQLCHHSVSDGNAESIAIAS